MTREEAIKVLQRMKYPYKCNKRKMIISNVDRDNEALEMAIQALSQEPCTVSVSEKEPNEITEEVTLRFFKNSLKVRWHDFVIYNVEWLKKNWQMEMDIVCGVKPCDDAVSREDAFEIIASNDTTDGTEPIFTGRQVVALLSTLPPVTQKCEKCAMNGSNSKYCDNCGQKSGKWNEYYTSQKGNDVFNCKECGHTFVVTQGKDNMNYCPNCGAKMESEEV